jgi:amino acid adenylation domain-containing protein
VKNDSSSSELDSKGDLKEWIAKLSPAKRALFEAFLRDQDAANPRGQNIPRRIAAEHNPLSFSQQRLWILDQLEPNESVYNESFGWRLRGDLHVEALRQALDGIVARHEPLRTTYEVVDGEPVQRNSVARRVDLNITDLSQIPTADCAAQVQRLLKQEASRPFSLSSDLMLRVSLLKLSAEEHILLFVLHHIAMDSWSMGVLSKELSALYEACSTGKPLLLPELPIQYADYAVWQREVLQQEVLDRDLPYWKKQLTGASVLELPTDRPRPATQSYRGDRQPVSLSKDLTASLKALSRREEVTLFMTLVAAFQTLLHRYSGQPDIVVGYPVAGRSRLETEGLIGFFVNNLVLRTDFSNDPSFCELLARVHEVAMGAYEHQGLPFEKLVEELRPERDPSRNPLFQVMFALQNVPNEELKLLDLTTQPVDVYNGTTKFDLWLFFFEEQNQLNGFLEYSTDLFDAETIERMIDHFQTLLEGIVANPEQRISALPLQKQAERDRLLIEWNDTAREYPIDSCIHELIEAQVQRLPNAVAVECDGQRLTYLELHRRANQLAHYLRKHDVGRGGLVGICMERSLEMVVGLLGILKAGSAYLPLDPAFPKERLAFMLEDAQAKAVVTQQKLLSELPEHHAQTICLDSDWSAIAQESKDNLTCDAAPQSLAYVMYTSGSTGKPKGVEITHRSVVNFLDSMREQPGITEHDILLAVTTISFDIAGLELYLPLLVGARVVIASREVAVDGTRLGQLLGASRATVMQATPATWRLLVEAGWKGGKDFKALVGGEALPKDLADQLIACGLELWNMYGPTETTVWSTCARISDTANGISIGKPIANTTIYILDAQQHLCPIGVSGELWIGGAGVALGYRNRPELTAQRFILDPFNATSGARLYRTGDRARWCNDGKIEHLGRLDDQVKIRGFRIELGEIESVLNQHPAVREAVVVALEDSAGDSMTSSSMDKRLVAYMVAPSDTSTSELRSFLKQKLPEFMMPSAFVCLDSLPLTPNGKVDRRALPAPDKNRPTLRELYVGPRGPLEETVARIWAETLKLEKVGVHDNFFEIGGHSLLILRVQRRLCEVLDHNVSVVDLFKHPTISSLVSLLSEDTNEQVPMKSIEQRAQRRKESLARRKRLANDTREAE